jgi:hypothetical protein
VPAVCESCGEPVVAGVQFCTNCGFYLDWNEASSEETSATATPIARRPPAAERPADDPGPAESATVVSAATEAATVRPLRPAAAPTEPVGTPCRRCGTSNPRTRRFCAKCGLYIGEPTSGSDLRAFAPAPVPWWRRLFRGRPGSERAARQAYRRSLPWPVRMRRVLILLGVLLLCFGYLRFVGRDPVQWTRHRIDAVRGTLVQVSGVTASSPAGASIVRDFAARNAVDGDSTTAWAVPFTGPSTVTGETCTAGSDLDSLLLQAPEQVTVRAIKVHGGFPGTLGTQNWRPRTLELWFPDGSCQRVELANSPRPQLLEIHPTTTNAVRVAVVAGYVPRGRSQQPLNAITEIALLSRPR